MELVKAVFFAVITAFGSAALITTLVVLVGQYGISRGWWKE